MSKPKVDTFLDLVRRSGLVEKDQLTGAVLALKEQTDGGPVTDTELLAERLTDAGLLTAWQCEKLIEGRHKGLQAASRILLPY
jgi:hypothetical protein